MSSRLDRNTHFLRLLASSKPSEKKKLVEHVTKDQMDTRTGLKPVERRHPFRSQPLQQTQTTRPKAESLGQKERFDETKKTTPGATTTWWIFTALGGIGSHVHQFVLQAI